jgi:hypothetical protein
VFFCLQLSFFLSSQGQHLPQNSPLDSSGFFFLSFCETPVEQDLQLVLPELVSMWKSFLEKLGC